MSAPKCCQACAHWSVRPSSRAKFVADGWKQGQCQRGPMMQDGRFPFKNAEDWCWYFVRVDGLWSRLLTWWRSA